MLNQVTIKLPFATPSIGEFISDCYDAEKTHTVIGLLHHGASITETKRIAKTMTNTASEYASFYSTLIDQQTWAFIDRTNQCYPPDTINFSMQKQRAIYDAMCREFHTTYPVGVSSSDDTIQSDDHKIPVRRYTTKNADASVRIIYLHGGGFVVGGLTSHDDICSDICAATKLEVTAVDYRLAPENLHPCAFNDALASVMQEYEQFNVPLILCGDSAGGNLAAAVSHQLRDTNAPVVIAGQVLIYPALGGEMGGELTTTLSDDTTTSSYDQHHAAPMLTREDMDFYSSIRADKQQDLNVVSLAPLVDDNFANLPETITFSAQCDPLADDAKLYAAAINAAGGNATWYNEKGLVHGYLRARHTVDRARQSFKNITDSLSSLAAKY